MSEDNKYTESYLNKNLLGIGLSILVVGAVLVALAPYIFTQFSLAYDLSDKGPIGDSISGTTAPIVGLVGAVLVFLSLYAQIQANRLVLREFKEDRERYETELRQRENDRKEEASREQFRTLVDLVRSQNEELMAAT